MPQRYLPTTEGKLTVPQDPPSQTPEEQQKALPRRRPAPSQIPPGLADAPLPLSSVHSSCAHHTMLSCSPSLVRCNHSTGSHTPQEPPPTPNTRPTRAGRGSHRTSIIYCDCTWKSPAICARGYRAIPTDSLGIITPSPAQLPVFARGSKRNKTP